MRPTFYGLEIAKTGMFMAQKQLDVTGHNLANENTVGFTRQRIVQQAIDPYSVNTRLKDMETGKVGAGVQTQSLDQIRDLHLDQRIRTHNSTATYWADRYEGLYEVESLFTGELGASDTSLIKLTSDFFNAVDKLSDNKASSDREIRTNMAIAAGQLCSAVNDLYSQLEELQLEHETIITQPKAGLVAKTNQIIDDLVEYNRQILAFEMTGEQALDLRDQRNLLLDELSTLVDMDYHEDAEGKLHVSISGTEVVNHRDSQHLYTQKTLTNPLNGNPNELSIVCWENGSQPLLKSGKIKAELDLRDGVVGDTNLGVNSVMGIPQIVEQMNQFVRSLAQEFNAIHESAWTYPNDENGNVSKTGISFFEVPPGGYKDLTIGNFKIDAMIDKDRGGSIFNIAISSREIDATDPDLKKEQANNVKGLELKALLYKDIPGVGSLRSYIQTFLVSIGAETNVAESRKTQYESISYELSQMFSSYSGVSKDEEMVNLIRFNHAFTAASRNITAIDEQLDVLINRMGRVGL